MNDEFKISPEWTSEDRLQIIIRILPVIQADIYSGQYSIPGRPNIDSLLSIATEPASVLEQYRQEVQDSLDEIAKIEPMEFKDAE